MTNKQKQHLLAFLGYYKEDVDGIWGEHSEDATKEFQRAYGLEDDGVFGKKTDAKIRTVIGSGKEKAVEDSGDWWKEIKYFDKTEFACKCGGKYCKGYPADMQKKVVQVADRARKHFGAEAYVTSGLRCEKHNANSGGVSNSRHMSGKAIDFRIKGKTAAQLLAYVQKQPEIRYAYAIDNNHVHMDIY